MKKSADIDAIVHDLKSDFDVLRSSLTAGYTVGMSAAAEEALARLETFTAIAVRVMRQTNPSKLRDAARTEEIKARLDGRPIIEA